jgi:2-iminobutanoate/2-iminopropanoate deaminase
MKRDIISTINAPQAIGPYSQAVRVGSFVHTAGQVAIDPQTGQLVAGDITAQAEQVMKNLTAVLTAAGTSLDNVVKSTIFLRYIKDFAAVNEVYGRYFGEGKPARSTVAVSALPLTMKPKRKLKPGRGKLKRRKKPRARKNKNLQTLEISIIKICS